MIETLRRVAEIDTDDIVRGHSDVTMEALETWMEKSVMRGVRELGNGFGGIIDSRRGVGVDVVGKSGLRGLVVNPDRDRKDVIESIRPPRIEDLG